MNSLLLRVALLFLLYSAAAFPQKLLIEVDTQEGQLLQQIDSEENATKKLVLLERFAKLFPNHEAITWVLGQVQTAYIGTKEFDKALEVGTRLLGLDPDDVMAAHNCLRAIEAKKDVDLIRRWSEQTAQIARKIKQSPKPDDPEEVEDWKQKVESAKQVEQYTEYSLYFAALQSKDVKVKNKMIEVLEARNPMSEYLAQLRTSQTQVIRQVDIEEAVASAEIQFKKGQYSVDSLMMVANYYMNKRRESERVIAYSGRLVEMLNSQPKPEELGDAEWDKKKRTMLGTAYWMMGLLFSTQERYSQADRSLRAALPNLRNSDMLAGALYHLGYVNFRLAEAGDRIRIHDAVRFTQECISIPSSVQAQAMENLKSMKSEYNLQD